MTPAGGAKNPQHSSDKSGSADAGRWALITPELRDFWRHYVKNRTAVFGAVVLTVIVLASVFAPILAPYRPEKQNLREIFDPPSLAHPFGTDEYGRDQFSRALYGGRVTMLVAFGSVSVAVLVGVSLGMQAGFVGGPLDVVLMRVTDAVMAFPTFFLLSILSVVLGPNLPRLILILGLTSWTVMARVVRAEVLSIKERDYIMAAVTIGCTSRRIMLKHVLPNLRAVIIVASTLQIAFAVLTEAGLSFLNLGVRPPTPSWGNMLMIAQKNMFGAPWVLMVPGALIFLTVLSLNFVGDGLRDSLDPRLRQR
jgi:peptide/nickel transport system permease protein